MNGTAKKMTPTAVAEIPSCFAKIVRNGKTHDDAKRLIKLIEM